jgi:hypothetical protein
MKNGETEADHMGIQSDGGQLRENWMSATHHVPQRGALTDGHA